MKPWKRRDVLRAGGIALFAPALLHAQTDWRRVAVPAYTPPAFVDGALRFWYLPRADEFAVAAARLVESLGAGCDGDTPRAAWRATLLAWTRLNAVAVGPLIERRSARRIDFVPTRPEQIERAIERRPESAADMERIGSAAKGFAALEWLLWRPTNADGCRYALQLARDIAAEADALAAAFKASAALERDDEAVVAAMGEAVNQWIGGLEALRLQGLERPLHDARSRGRSTPALPRALSGASAAERGARWEALRALALFGSGAAPAAGEGLVPLETYLRGKGLNPLADRLRSSAAAAETGLRAAASDKAAALQAATRPLAALKALVEGEVAPALDVRVGFSDADGD